MTDTSVIKTAATLTMSLYGRPGALDVAWIHKVDGPICWGLHKVDGLWYLVFRGSVTKDDWLHDFEAVAIYDEKLGCHVHPGFHQGIADIYAQALTIIGSGDYAVCGHSLGAARAANAAAYGIIGARKPVCRVAWGEPRPGFGDMARLLAAIPNCNFVNGGADDYDRVTDVPFTLPFEYYCAGAPHLFVNEPPAQDNFDILFRWHNFMLYETAMNKLPDGEM